MVVEDVQGCLRVLWFEHLLSLVPKCHLGCSICGLEVRVQGSGRHFPHLKADIRLNPKYAVGFRAAPAAKLEA